MEKNKPGVTYLHWINGLTTFSYGVLQSSLSLYLTKQIGLSQFQSNSLVGFFLAANFALHLVSGYIGDRLLSNRYVLALSTLIQTIGILILTRSVHTPIYVGLSLFLIGSGLSTTALNCLLMQQFSANENAAREKAFFYNYSAMNIGAFSGFIFAGFIDLQGHYEKLFGLCNAINCVSLLCIMKSWRYFNSIHHKKTSALKHTMGLFSIFALIPLLFIGFHYSDIANYLILSLGILALLSIFLIGYVRPNKIEKGNIYAYLLLTSASIIFWMLYYVEPMGLTQFLKYNINMTLFGYSLPPQWIINLNPIFVILGSPLMIRLFSKLRNNKVNVSISLQFILSLIMISLSFFALSLGVSDANIMGFTNGNWIVLHFILLSTGELLIAPVGYAMIGQLAPEKLQSIMMGIWMMASGIASTLSYYFSTTMTLSESLDPLISNPYYLTAFTQLGLCALATSILLFFCSSFLKFTLYKRESALALA